MVSLRPSSFVEGGAVPVDRNLRWEEVRFALWDYQGKAPQTTALCINFKDDDGQEYTQYYSAASPDRFVPSEDGKQLVAVGDAQALSKSSNAYVLLNALVNAGFPENKLDDDISGLDGLYAHHIGIPMPKRAGLASAEPVEGGRERVLSVPDQILELPGEGKKTPAKSGRKSTAKAEDTGTDDDVAADAVALATELVAGSDNGTVTRQQVATAAVKGKKNAVAKLVFTAGFADALTEGGLTVNGEEISIG